jgi:hypothetical protein
MIFWQGAFTLFTLLGLSHVLCILAKKEEGIVRTVGYTLAVCLVILSILYLITEVDLTSSSTPLQKVTPKIAHHKVLTAVKK